MAQTAADILIEVLQEWGVDTVFGLPGDGINGIMEALRKKREEIRFVQVRHEEAAAFMACGYAKFTGRLGVCLATSGPGGLHLLNGMYDAKLDGAAILAITGLPFHDLIGTFTQQDVELDKVFQDCCVYNARVMGPTHVEAHELGKRLRDYAIVTCDSGTIATWWARHIPVKRGQLHTLSGTLASMAPGLPYAIAAQIAYPNREVVAFVGDGGFSMLMADFVTAVKYKLPIKVVIIKNNYLGQIKWEQMVFLGNPEFGVDLQPIDFAAFAHACGGVGFSVEDPKKCGDSMEEFLATPGPALLEAEVDPLTAPMPGKIKGKQALRFAESLVRGEPDAVKIAQEAFKDKVR